MLLILLHLVLAAVLFKLVNLLGEHATDFGYASTTLFEEPNESLALNFFIRAFAPAVFVVAFSAASVAAGYENLRLGIYWVAIFYYLLRVAYVFAVNIFRLVSWPALVFHAAVGLGATWIVYRSLILPNRSLLPNLDSAGNELWLAIFAFLYAAANKVTLSSTPGDRRRNAFIKRSYESALHSYGTLIDAKIADERLRLIAYAILIYEDYCRPPAVRTIERLMFWRTSRTTGIMQVSSSLALSDEESVKQGTEMLLSYWELHAEAEPWSRAYNTITGYNKDANYYGRVFEVMAVLAKRAAPRFQSAYNGIVDVSGV